MTLEEHPIDEDYIDPPRRRADLKRCEPSESEEDVSYSPHPSTRSDASQDISESIESYDWSHLFHEEEDWDDIIDAGPNEQVRAPSTRTVFNIYEAPSDREEKWQRLRKWQDDMWTKSGQSRGQQHSKADKRRTVMALCSSLDVTSYQKERALHIASRLNFKHMAHYSRETVALSIITLVANEDGRWIREEPRFTDIMEDIGTNPKDVRNCRLLVRSKSDSL